MITRWLRDNAHVLGDDLEPLRDVVGDARVVAIGESTHRVHEFYELRHRMTRFLVEELGFTAFVMESGFPEGLRVNDWVLGGDGDLDSLLHNGITYHMGRCAEMREHLSWLRAYNETHDRPVRFYGMDVPDSAASARPAVEACLDFLADADPAYAAAVSLDFGYLPDDRTGLAWAAPALHAYLALDAATRNELTAGINELTERLAAQRVVYAARTSQDRADVAYRCAATARHMDAFLQAMAAAPTRTYEGANIRDAAMAENVRWILEREERIVVVAANGHVQRWPFSAPLTTNPLTMLGEHLAASLGDQLVVIATTFGGGTLFLHRPVPGGPPGHTETFTEELTALDPTSLDALLASAGLPDFLLDLRTATGPAAARLAEARSIMTGMQPTPVDPMTAFDAVVHIARVTPWHTSVGRENPANSGKYDQR